MQTALLIESYRTQLILHPENDHDKAVIDVLSKLPNTFRDRFYPCQGNYTRHETFHSSMYAIADSNPDLLIVFDKPTESV